MRKRAWHSTAIELKRKGLSNYDIARQVFGKASKESTLRYFFSHPEVQVLINRDDDLKILFWDIEISPFVSFHYDKYGVNIGNDHHITEKFLFSHAWSWGMDGEINASILTSEEARNQNDVRLVEEAWNLLDSADIVVAHNGYKFDIPVMNGYFLKYGFPPPSPFKIIDTYRMAKKNFKLTSNSLAYLAKFLGVPLKLDSGGVSTWKGAYFGDQESLDNMFEYNKGDIVTLRAVYERLRSWGGSGVNLGMYSSHGAVCSHCRSDNISIVDNAYHVTTVSKFNVVRCGDCGGVSRLRKKESHDVAVSQIR